jgi:hypothetical protein
MPYGQLTPDDVTVLLPPRPQALEELDHSVRLAFADVSPPGSRDSDLIELLQNSARFLEQRRAIAGISEAIQIKDIRTVTEFLERAAEVVQLARHLTRIDPIEVLVRDPQFAQQARRRARELPSPEERPEGFFASVVRAIQSLIVFCPIEELVEIGRTTGRIDLAHRCRLSYDWLRAFARRNAAQQDSTQHITGRAYAEGRLSLQEVSSLVGFSITDLVAWLEEHGYARELEVIELSSEARRERLDRIREERLRRGGVPDPNPDHITRDTVASHRIEDLDARPWLHDQSPA